jgi:1-acyl-sn-glycerol-3-phosphate acyltransferase
MSDKIINSRCICRKGLTWVNKKVIMLMPCEHMIHERCFKKKKICPFCDVNVETTVSLDDFKNDNNLYQQCIDIMSATNFDKLSSITYYRLIYNSPNIISLLSRLMYMRNASNLKSITNDILQRNNIRVIVDGLDKIKHGKKVFISNHTSTLDTFAIYNSIDTGFLCSSSIRDSFLSENILNILPLLYVNRGSRENTVERMKEYVEKNGSICLFPEGALTPPNTIIRFRTGAFNIGYPIYPIVLKYSKCISDMSHINCLLKIGSCTGETIHLSVLDPVYPPFDNEKIENIRKNMATHGSFVMSRVSNRDIQEP